MKKVLQRVKMLGVAAVLGCLLSVCTPTSVMETEAAPQSCPHYKGIYHLLEVPTCDDTGWYYVDCACCGKLLGGGELRPYGHTFSRSYGNGKVCTKCRKIVK